MGRPDAAGANIPVCASFSWRTGVPGLAAPRTVADVSGVKHLAR